MTLPAAIARAARAALPGVRRAPAELVDRLALPGESGPNPACSATGPTSERQSPIRLERDATTRRVGDRRSVSQSAFRRAALLIISLAVPFVPAAQAQNDALVKARPDFQNQLYLAAPTHAPGTSLAQPASVAIFSGSLGDATNAANAAPNDGFVFLAQSLVGQSFAAPPASLVAPTILAQPSDTFVSIGSNAALTVLVSSDSPASYQWFRNGTMLAGATNSTLVFNNPQFTNSGSFFVTISNASGSITSQIASFAAASKVWTGLGDGVSWNNAANWSGNAAPNSADSIFIGSGSGTITNVPGGLTLNNLLCQRTLSLTGSLTVTGAVQIAQGVYALAISVTASGPNASFTDLGATNLTGVSFHALQGGLTSLPALTNYHGGADFSCSLRASGAGSLLDLPALQTVTGPVAQASYLTIQALQGGMVKLTNVQTITVNYVYGGASSIGEHGIRIFADGTNSVVDLSGLLRFAGDGTANYSSIQPSSGGQILLDKLGSATAVSLIVSNGMTFRLSALTNYDGGVASSCFLQASGAGSLLDLPALQTVTGPVAQVSYLTIQALQGGMVKLTNVQTITVNYVYGGASAIAEHGIRLFADGTNSVLDLSGLRRFAGDGSANFSSIQPSSGGQILLDKLHSATAVSLIVSNGMTLRLSALTNYDGGVNSSCFLQASGAGSLLDLPALQTVTGPVSQVSYLTIQALQGGVVKLTNVQTITVNYVYGGASAIAEHGVRLLADGTNSVLDLSGLRRFGGDGSGNYSVIQPSGGGQILLDQLGWATAVSLVASNGMTLRLSALTNYDGARSSRFLEASGAGSVLDLPALRTVTGPVSQANYLTIRAVQGGAVRMTNVQTMTVNYVFDGVSALHDHGVRVLADGNSSIVNLLGLAQFTQGDHANESSSIVQTNAGLVLLRTNLVISPGAILALTPTILTQPQGTSVFAGSNVTFAVTAAGSPLFYQWFFNQTTPVMGATSAGLSFPAGYNQRGNYRLIVTNTFGSATSMVVTLQVAQPLTVVVQGRGTVAKLPDTASCSFGQAVLLTATAGRYYNFAGWSDGATNNPRSVTLTASNNYYAAIFTNGTGGILEELIFPQWEKVFGGIGDDYLRVVRATGDGGIILGGYSNSPTNDSKTVGTYGGRDYWVLKLDATGGKQWERDFGGVNDEYVQDIVVASDGGYLLVGYSSSEAGTGNKTVPRHGNESPWLIKLDANGNEQWQRSFGTNYSNTSAESAQQTADGGFAFAGGVGTNGYGGGPGMWLVKLDANGQQQWEQTYSSPLAAGAQSVVITPDGGYFLGGAYRTSPAESQLRGIKVDASGAVQADGIFGGSGDDTASAVAQTVDGGHALVGYSASPPAGNKSAALFGGSDYWLVRLDAAGGKLWDQSFGGTLNEEPGALQNTPDGGFLIGGYSLSTNSGSKSHPGFGARDGWVVKTDAGGLKQWELSLGGTGNDEIRAAQVLPDGYLLAGYTESTNGSGTRTAPGYGGQDYWLVKLLAREAPVGLPLVLVNGEYSPSNFFAIPATNSITVTLQTSYANGYLFYTLNGSLPVAYDYEGGTFTYADEVIVGTSFTLTNSAVLTTVAYDAGGGHDVYGDPVVISIVPVYGLTNTTPGGGGIAMNPPGGIYLSNTVVTLTPVASNGWTFLRWEGAVTNTSNPLNLTMDSSKSVRAVFVTGLANPITPAGSGTVSLWPAAGPYPYGGVVRLTGVPGPTNRFNRWFNNINGPTNSLLTFTVLTPNTNINAYFAPLGTNFTLTALLNGYGTVTRTPVQNSYASNSLVQFTAVPDAGHVFTGWSGDAGGSSLSNSLVMNASKVVTANFLPVAPPAITAQPQSLMVNRDSNATFTVSATGVPFPAYQWLHAGTNLPGATSATLNIASAQKADGGSYYAVVTNPFGSATSSVAVLTVNLPYTWITLAGLAGQIGTVDGQGSSARLSGPYGIAADSLGNLYASDAGGETIRKITPAGLVSTLAGAAGQSGGTDGTGGSARFRYPIGIAVNSDGRVYVGEYRDHRIRTITPAGVVSTLATLSGQNGLIFASLDGAGDLYVTDGASHTIRKVTSSGVVSTVAGLAGNPGSDDGLIGTARFNSPDGVALDSMGNIFVSEYNNHTIRKISTNGIVSTVAGQAGSAGSLDGPAGSARFNAPHGIAVDGDGNVFISEAVNSTIRRVTAAGAVDTIGGLAGIPGSLDGAGSNARFTAGGVAVDGVGNLYLADTSNHTIRKGIPNYGQPIIYGQPQSQTNSVSAAVTLSVTNTGVLPLAYQWLFNGTNLAGATAVTLNLASFQATNVGSYFVIVSNVYGSATSSVAVLSSAAPNQPPVVAITSPAAGAFFVAPASIALSASATDGDGVVTNVSFYAGTTLIGRVTNAPFNFNWSGVGAGSYALTAVATDNSGLSATSSPAVSITVTTAVPVVDLTSPVNNNSYVAPASILLRAVVSDDDLSVAWVDFFNGGTLLGSVTNAPSQPTHQLTLPSVGVGSYSFYAVVHDGYGPVVTSAPPASITVNPPFVRPSLRFATTNYTVDESAGSVTLTVVKDGTGPASVSFQTVDGQTLLGSAHYTGDGLGDYANTFGSLSFASNVTSRTITVLIGDDFFAEPAENFSVQLTDPDAGSDLGTPSTAVVTILASDAGADTNSLLTPVLPGSINVTRLGSLQIYLNGASGLGQWRFDWDSVWRNGASVAAGLEPGNWDVAYRAVPAWQEPEPQNLAVPASTARVVTNGYGGGSAATGGLRVYLEPALGSGLFAWRVGSEPWRASGVLAALPPGVHVVEFQPVAGWTTPSARLALVFEGGDTEITAAYQVAVTPPLGVVLPEPVASLNEMESGFFLTPRRPYMFNGQLRTAAGFGSGFGVRSRVVLTAAHVVFDDVTLSMVPGVDFLPRRLSGEFEPLPRRARGWVVMPGYIEQRLLERTNGAAPGVASPASEALDVAAIWFDEDVLAIDGGAGGAGGYLVSGANGTNYLEAALQVLLTGYPVERSDGLAISPGRLYRLEKLLPSLTKVDGDARLYESAGFLSFPGNSGGPLLAKAQVTAGGSETYFPAGIYLGTTGNKSRVRTLDTNVLALINTAASAANLGTNFTGGGAINLAVAGGLNHQKAGLNLVVGPPAALAAGGGWRITNLAAHASFTTAPTGFVQLVVGQPYYLEFRAATNWATPTNLSLNLPARQTSTVNFAYVSLAAPPSIGTPPASIHAVVGETIPFRVVASGAAPLSFAWQRNSVPVAGASSSALVLTNVSLAQTGSYRVVVSNVAGSVTSAPAALTITALHPVLTYDFSNGLWLNWLNGPTARNHQIETNASLDPARWGLWQTVALTNSPARITAPFTNLPSLFFRSRLESVP